MKLHLSPPGAAAVAVPPVPPRDTDPMEQRRNRKIQYIQWFNPCVPPVPPKKSNVQEKTAEVEGETFAGLVEERAAMEAGHAPAAFTAPCLCAGCGPVFLWPEIALIAPRAPNGWPFVLGCPWCHNRRAGRPIPRPGALSPT